jgi:tetratricopeptide (TPR) repeat protein
LPAELPAEIEVTQSLLKITKSKQLDTRSIEVNEAYTAYQQGDYAAARSMYEDIVRNIPESRDGLLGLAAISLVEGNQEQAFEFYAQVVKVDPQNTVANAAILNMVNTAQEINQESSIKLMLYSNPEASFLHFTLGNIYAAQTRWAEAQQAYFDAYRHDSTNPNYALNLAISLDRLSHKEAALDYYNTALELADSNLTQFDSASILSRINTLNNN